MELCNSSSIVNFIVGRRRLLNSVEVSSVFVFLWS
jgi:hypothetical protein